MSLLVFSVTIAALRVTEAAVHLQDLKQDLTVAAIDNGKSRFVLAFFFFFFPGVRLYLIYENIFQNY